MMSTLETTRLIMRPLRQEDSSAIQELFPHWEIVKHLSDRIPWPYPENGAAEYVRMTLARTSTCEDDIWAITNGE